MASRARKVQSWLTKGVVMAGMMLAPTPAAANDNAFSMRQQDCTALAIYWEARGRSPVAQVAVAHVVRNRMSQAKWPSTPCGVVFQRDRRRCQFDFACRRRPVTDMAAWHEARRMAALAERVPDLTGGATYFHASYVRPNWSNLRRVARLDGNVFYAERRR